MQLLYFPVYITLRLLSFNTKSPSMFTIIYISALLGAVSIVIYIVTQLIDNRSPSRKLGERLLDENSTGIMPFYEGRDPSHGYQHVISVTKRVIDIISDMDLLCESSYYKRKVLHAENISKNDVTIAIFAALLHDAYDHKYIKKKGDIDKVVKDISNFLYNRGISRKDIQIIHSIIENISFSREFSSRKKTGKPGTPVQQFKKNRIQLTRDIVSDADKIESLGLTAIERMIQYQNNHLTVPHEKYSEEWYQEHLAHIHEHCDEKLYILLPKFYIRTEKGREIAKLEDSRLREITADDRALRHYIFIYTDPPYN